MWALLGALPGPVSESCEVAAVSVTSILFNLVAEI